MTEPIDEIKSDLTLIKISIATQAADLGYIKEKVGKIDVLDDRLRAVETATAKVPEIEDLKGRVRDVELCQAADRTRRNWQDGISAALAVLAGILGVSK